MPIIVHADLRQLDQAQFGQIAFDVMEQAFAIHNRMGRFFCENVYRDALAHSVPGAQVEVLIEVRFGDFVKEYYIDLLVNGGAVFELKTVETLGSVHRAQLLNYLLLTGLSHGKIINLRPEAVDHEFVNSHLTRTDCTSFSVSERDWNDPGAARRPLQEWLLELLRDIGSGLDVHLYEAAVVHFFGGDEAVVHDVEIFDGTRAARLAKNSSSRSWLGSESHNHGPYGFESS